MEMPCWNSIRIKEYWIDSAHGIMYGKGLQGYRDSKANEGTLVLSQ